MNASISDYEVQCTFGRGSDTPGPDGISARLIDKADRDLMHECLSLLWNKSWDHGYFVSEWKQENRVIIPKPDKDDYNECSAYRTISLTSCLGKRFENITAQRLSAVLESRNFDKDQFAYLHHRSTTQALMILVENVKKSLIDGEAAGAVFYDFSDAFGSVNRNRLLYKLGKDFKVAGKLFLHIQSFLSNRLARLKINSSFGDWIQSDVGTSAGTQLGPLLFIIYIHDVPKCIRPKYADDLVAVATGEDIDVVERKLQNASDELMTWAENEEMAINISKTKVMVFGSRKKDVTVKIEGLALQNVSSYKYLGVILDENLNFSLQVDNAVCKAKRASSKIMSLIYGRRGIPVQSGISLYKTLVRPHLEYAMPVWANVCDKDLRKLEDVQVQSIRRIIGAKAHSSSSAVEVVSGILPVNVRKREMCHREYIRIMSFGDSHPLMDLMKTTKRSGLQFCPLKYIQIMSRELERSLKECKIELYHTASTQYLITPLNISSIQLQDIPEYNIDDVDVNVSTTVINHVIEKISDKHVVVFTDGSVYKGRIGCGACSAVLYPIKSDVGDPCVTSRAVGQMVSSEKCETAGLLLGMEVALQYLKQQNVRNHSGIIYVFSDCSNAIDIVTLKTGINRYPEIFHKLQDFGTQFHQLSCRVKLVKIPGHKGIHGNELADLKAKELTQMIVMEKISAPKIISVADARHIATEIAKNSWQRKWNEDNKGRSTYDLIPVVGTKITWPQNRDVGISYCRILLNDTMLNKDSHRTGTSDTAMCECGEDDETITHMLLHCNKYTQARMLLTDTLDDICTSSKHKWSTDDKVKILLGPPLDNNISKRDNHLLKGALFQFIYETDRKL